MKMERKKYEDLELGDLFCFDEIDNNPHVRVKAAYGRVSLAEKDVTHLIPETPVERLGKDADAG